MTADKISFYSIWVNNLWKSKTCTTKILNIKYKSIVFQSCFSSNVSSFKLFLKRLTRICILLPKAKQENSLFLLLLLPTTTCIYAVSYIAIRYQHQTTVQGRRKVWKSTGAWKNRRSFNAICFALVSAKTCLFVGKERLPPWPPPFSSNGPAMYVLLFIALLTSYIAIH